MRKLSKLRFVIPLVIIGMLPVKSAHAIFFPDLVAKYLYDAWLTVANPPGLPKKPEGSDMSDPDVLDNYMGRPFNTRFIDSDSMDEITWYGFGDCGDNLKGTGVESNRIGEYGKLAGEVPIYGYRNVLISYYSDGTDGYNKWELLGSKLSVGIPVYEKETVNIRIADDVGDVWESKLPDLIMIQCSNLDVGDTDDNPVNTVYDYGDGFMVLSVVEVIQTGDQYYSSFLPHEGGLRLFDQQILVPDDTRKSTAKLDTDTGMLIIPELVTDDGTDFAVYYTNDGWAFRAPVNTTIEVGESTEYEHSYSPAGGYSDSITLVYE